MTIGDVFIRSGPDYGSFRNGGPYGACIHDLECPITVDVRQLAGPGSYTQNSGVSPHTMSDLTRVVQILDETHSGAHVGGVGNPLLVGFEVVGRAAWSTDQWMADIRNLLSQARAVANLWRVMGWSADDLRWGSIAELRTARARYNNGQGPAAPRMWTHNDVSEALGGTDHWDPGLGFPFAKFQEWCHQYLVGDRGPGGGTPNPQPPGGGGGGAEGWFLLDWLVGAA